MKVNLGKKKLLGRTRLAPTTFFESIEIVALQLLAASAHIDAATHIWLFRDRGSTGRARGVYRILAQDRLIPAGAAKQVVFGVAPAMARHRSQDAPDRGKHGFDFLPGQAAHFLPGVDARRPKDILQHAVPQSGDALLSRQESFGRKSGRFGAEERFEIGPVEGIRQWRRLLAGDIGVGESSWLASPEAKEATPHLGAGTERRAILELDQELVFARALFPFKMVVDRRADRKGHISRGELDVSTRTGSWPDYFPRQAVVISSRVTGIPGEFVRRGIRHDLDDAFSRESL